MNTIMGEGVAVNTKYWDNLKTVPIGALKTIEFGKLKGKSDINPQWRYEAMTKEFGPCSIGWKYEIVKTWTQEAPNNQIMLFVEINLHIKDGEKWSAAIPAIGGDFLVEKDKNGLHGNDEAYKMATTDALGVAMKMLGVAADVYRGLANDSKYGREKNGASQQDASEFQQAISQDKKQQAQNTSNPAIKWEQFWTNVKIFGMDETQVFDFASNHFEKPVKKLEEVITTQLELNKFTAALAKTKKPA